MIFHVLNSVFIVICFCAIFFFRYYLNVSFFFLSLSLFYVYCFFIFLKIASTFPFQTKIIYSTCALCLISLSHFNSTAFLEFLGFSSSRNLKDGYSSKCIHSNYDGNEFAFCESIEYFGSSERRDIFYDPAGGLTLERSRRSVDFRKSFHQISIEAKVSQLFELSKIQSSDSVEYSFRFIGGGFYELNY